MYRFSKDQYDTVVNNSIASTYKKAHNKIKKKTNVSGRKILILILNSYQLSLKYNKNNSLAVFMNICVLLAEKIK